MRRLVLQVQIDAPGSRQRERHEVGIGGASQVGLDARDRLDDPGAIVGTGVEPRVTSIGVATLHGSAVPDRRDHEVLGSEQSFEQRPREQIWFHRVLRPVCRERCHLAIERRRHVDGKAVVDVCAVRRRRGSRGTLHHRERATPGDPVVLLCRCEHEAGHVVAGDDVRVARKTGREPVLTEEAPGAEGTLARSSGHRPARRRRRQSPTGCRRARTLVHPARR